MGLDPYVFWRLTPREFHYISKGFNEKLLSERRESWDQMRLQTYYIYCSIPKGKGKRNPTYKQFCAQHIPMPWDRISKGERQGLYEDEQPQVTPQMWADKIKELSNAKSRQLGASEVKSI